MHDAKKKQPVTSDLRELIEQCLQNTPQFGFQVRLGIGNMSKKRARGKLPAAPGNRNKSAQERSKREKRASFRPIGININSRKMRPKAATKAAQRATRKTTKNRKKRKKNT